MKTNLTGNPNRSAGIGNLTSVSTPRSSWSCQLFPSPTEHSQYYRSETRHCQLFIETIVIERYFVQSSSLDPEPSKNVRSRSSSWQCGGSREPADCCGELSRGNLGGNNWPLSRCWFRSIEWCGGGGTRQPCYATLLLDYNMFLSIMCIFLSHFRGWQSSVKIKKD